MRQQTIDIYNTHAQIMAEKFRASPPRLKHINIALKATQTKEPRVLEIGCGDGRDAKEIFTRVSWYKGIDVSSELIKLARQHVPHAEFEVADAVTYDYPKNIDLVIAFASFIHLDRDEFSTVLGKLHSALNQAGVIYLSLKWAPEYVMKTNIDTFGERQYYFYNSDVVQEIAGKQYQLEKSWQECLPNANHTQWIEVILRKN